MEMKKQPVLYNYAYNLVNCSSVSCLLVRDPSLPVLVFLAFSKRHSFIYLANRNVHPVSTVRVKNIPAGDECSGKYQE